MKTRLFLYLSLLAGLLVACTPSAVTGAPEQPAVIVPTTTFPPPVPTLDHGSQPTAGPTQDVAPTPLPIVTSRGPELHATDPGTVSLASGQVQFVEFFRFT